MTISIATGVIPDSPLNANEAATLASQEAIIERGLQTFYEVGTALVTIRDRQLYRQGFGTFEDYCRERWGLSRPRAYQLMEAATIRENLSTIVDTLPANEAQTRPLAALSPDKQAQAWQEAVHTAPGGKVTAAHVAATVDRITAPPPPPLARINENMSEAQQRPTMFPVATERAAREVAQHEAAIDGLDRLSGGAISRAKHLGDCHALITKITAFDAMGIAAALDEPGNDMHRMTFDASLRYMEEWIAKCRAARADRHRVVTLVPRGA